MTVRTMRELFLEELKDIYSAEKQITKTLPKIAKASSSTELRSAFENHLRETHGHIERLDRIGELLGKSLSGKTCQGMKGVLEEGAEMLDATEMGSLRDAALISAAQRVEHYEISIYGTLREYARLLDLSQVASLLEQTLKEEGEADQKLTSISKHVNQEAKIMGSDKKSKAA